MSMGYYNPAFAGQSENLNVLGLHRIQWVGISGAPQSTFVMADMPLRFGKTQHGVGVLFFSESIGLFNNMHIAGQYAYKRKLFGGTLSIGLQAGVVNQVFDGEKALLPEKNKYMNRVDGAIPLTVVEAMALDLNLGLFYAHEKFYVGLGATHVTEPELQFDDNVYSYVGRALNLTGGYNIQTANPLYELQPSVFLKTDMISFQADITARVIYNKMFNGGVTWRVNESFVLLLGATLGRFQVGYAYDFPYNSLLRASSGSHELMVKFSLKLNKTKTGNYKHKSVRVL